MKEHQKQFINFLVKSGALTFGDFVTKSGRKTPYFVNMGNFNLGSAVSRLGEFYAAHIVESGMSELNVVFGPAYKGIPLSITTAQSLYRNHDIDVPFSFNRKEAKEHGDAGMLVGGKLNSESRVVVVEDVITAGTTMREIVPLMSSFGVKSILGVVIAVDRCERGQTEKSAVQEAEASLGLKIAPIVTVHDIIDHLSSDNNSGIIFTENMREKMLGYLKEYGGELYG
jgi:orotate phosphoribosyltransferase